MAESDKYLIGESLRQKLKSTIAKVDSIPFGGPVFRLPRGAVSDERTFVPKVFRVCTATGEWPVDTSKDVTFYGIESTPNTVSVLNKLVSLPAPSTATSRIVNVAKDGSQWYLVSFQMSSQTAVVATATGGAQAFLHAGVLRVKTQTHNVYRATSKRYRYFGAMQIAHAQCLGGGAGTRLSANFVMVGERPQLHPVGVRTFGQRLRRERTVGDDRVAMQIGVEDRHGSIVGGLHGFNLQLQFFHALPGVDVEAVSHGGLHWQALGTTKPNRVNQLPV